jgi:hypothetical protein
MGCFRNREEWINRYLDGELGPSETKRFEEHVAACQACQGELAQARSLFATLEGLQDVPVPDGFLAEVQAGLLPDAATRRIRWILIAQIATAMLLIGLALPQVAAQLEMLRSWPAPGWLSGQLEQTIAWGQGQWGWLLKVLKASLERSWAWPRDPELTGPQALAAAVVLATVWWMGNRLLLNPKRNRSGGTA